MPSITATCDRIQGASAVAALSPKLEEVRQRRAAVGTISRREGDTARWVGRNLVDDFTIAQCNVEEARLLREQDITMKQDAGAEHDRMGREREALRAQKAALEVELARTLKKLEPLVTQHHEAASRYHHIGQEMQFLNGTFGLQRNLTSSSLPAPSRGFAAVVAELERRGLLQVGK